jgi:hypothetical protein
VTGGAQLAELHAQSKAGAQFFLRQVVIAAAIPVLAIVRYVLHKEYGWFAGVVRVLHFGP